MLKTALEMEELREEKDHFETLRELRSYLADAEAWFARNAGLDA
jgi:hypothetical protein